MKKKCDTMVKNLNLKSVGEVFKFSHLQPCIYGLSYLGRHT
jgi:hypothetical protein